MFQANTPILIYDSKVSLGGTLFLQLQNLGFKNIRVASSADETMDLLISHRKQAQPFEVFFCSFNKQHQEGLKLVARVRGSEDFQNVACILTAPAIDLQATQDIIQMGVSQILIHPFTPESISAKLKGAWDFRIIQQKEAADPLLQMNSFVVNAQEQKGMVWLGLRGVINEHAKLPELNTYAGKHLALDMSGIMRMSSIGIRLWLTWLKRQDLGALASLSFERCRRNVLTMASSIAGFLPEKAAINSIFITYYNPDTEMEREIGFDLRAQTDATTLKFPKKIKLVENSINILYEFDDSIMPALRCLKKEIVVDES